MRESEYQEKVIKKIKKKFDLADEDVLKNDSAYISGIPDWTVFCGNKYAMLEIKISKDAKKQPCQPYYVDHFNSQAFARFIYPENEKEVLKDLEDYFKK